MDISRWLEQNVGARLLMLHDKVYIASDGRIGHTIPGGPSNLILHTVGAKTGQKRDNTLSYARDGDDYSVVASKGGDPKAPGWYHNLNANPNVEINVGPKRFSVTAKPVTPDDPTMRGCGRSSTTCGATRTGTSGTRSGPHDRSR